MFARMATPRTVRKALPGAIRRLRELQGFSLRAVAAKTDGKVSYGYWANIEAGQRNPTPSTLLAIARALGVDLDDISYTARDDEAVA